jgi:hypothetical protein
MRFWRWAAATAAVATVSACGFHPATRAVTAVGLAGDGRALVTTVGPTGDIRWIVDTPGTTFTYAPPEQATPPALTQQCVPSACYRVVPGRLAVEQSGDGGGVWTPAWQLPDDVYADLTATLGAPGLAALSVAVRLVPGGHEVFVATGRDGLLYRDVAGDWRRLGYPAGGEGMYYEPPARLAIDPRPLGPPIAAALPVLGALIAFTIGALVRGWPRRRRVYLVVAVTPLGAAVAYAGASFPDVGMLPGLLYGIPIIAGAVLATTLVAAGRPRRRPA